MVLFSFGSVGDARRYPTTIEMVCVLGLKLAVTVIETPCNWLA
jgi:hypothetical protein